MSPGMIIDGLAVGEEIGLIDSNRPNPNLVTFRQGQLKAAAAGIGASYSSISKSYDGTFSAQRQELVEQWVNYAVLTDEFTGGWLQPVYETAVSAAIMGGVLRLPRDVVPDTADDALYIAQAMPWIDPLKEAGAWVMLARAGFASEIEVLRRRGVNPRDFLEQSKAWREKTKGMVFTSNAANGATIAPPTGSTNASAAPGDGDAAGQAGAD
jgi:lambda family phage portal protein